MLQSWLDARNARAGVVILGEPGSRPASRRVGARRVGRGRRGAGGRGAPRPVADREVDGVGSVRARHGADRGRRLGGLVVPRAHQPRRRARRPGRVHRASRATRSTRWPSRLEREGFVEDASVFTWYVGRQGGLEIVPGLLRAARRRPHRQRARPAAHAARRDVRPRHVPRGLHDPADGATAGRGAAAPHGRRVPRRRQRPGGRARRLRPAGVTTLEGLLFPDTYQVSNADNEAQVVERMVGLMERVADQEGVVDGAAALGRTPYEILVIASMIEEEAKLDEDRAKIARVIYNRLYVADAAPDRRHRLLRAGPHRSRSPTCARSTRRTTRTSTWGCRPRRSRTRAGRRSVPR